MIKQPITYERSYNNSVIDGRLVVPELEPIHYVAGYSHHVKGKYSEELHTIEYRLAVLDDCAEGKKNCKSIWVGFKIGGAVSPAAIYKCKHGTTTFGLVPENK